VVEVVGQRVVDEVHLHPWLDLLIDQALVVCQIRTRLIRLMGLMMGLELPAALDHQDRQALPYHPAAQGGQVAFENR